ncbi:MAG TPA: cytochrome c1 [Rubrivivax sp.]|nr:cytochrome c1 [Pseudomonadota bacterium]HOW48332.1 cytochrome c1 [Rubrivivax sp.]HRY87917.1 cytochrome c1 [Rubrivivax sp.]HRZ60588.1 cytochrome c1 [Rubrivivax sp.]
MTKKILLALLLAVGAATSSFASGGELVLDRFPADRAKSLPALQNGAKLFVNYCLNCHAAGYMRFNRMRDIGLSDDQIRDNLIFGNKKVGDLMTVTMNPVQAKAWFGVVPPDLTVVARSRASGAGSGADYLYTYMRGFYRDDSTGTGWNNTVFPSVAMPHAMWELQGQQRAVFAEEKDPHDPAKTVRVFKGLELQTPGTMTPAQYNEATADLVAFMQWMAEPNRATRVRIGVFVMLFLAVFTVIAWRLNKAYWKVIK